MDDRHPPYDRDTPDDGTPPPMDLTTIDIPAGGVLLARIPARLLAAPDSTVDPDGTFADLLASLSDAAQAAGAFMLVADETLQLDALDRDAMLQAGWVPVQVLDALREMSEFFAFSRPMEVELDRMLPGWRDLFETRDLMDDPDDGLCPDCAHTLGRHDETGCTLVIRDDRGTGERCDCRGAVQLADGIVTADDVQAIADRLADGLDVPADLLGAPGAGNHWKDIADEQRRWFQEAYPALSASTPAFREEDLVTVEVDDGTVRTGEVTAVDEYEDGVRVMIEWTDR